MSDQTTEIIMPLMGEGITEATLVKWLKNPGDKLEKDEPLLEVSTDKVDTEIPSPASGFLIKTTATAGETVAINSTIGFISENPDAKVADTKASQAKPASEKKVSSPQRSPSPYSAPPMTSTQPSAAGPVRSSPLVRKIARDMNINLGAVSGRGLYGRITKDDVLNFVHQIQGQMTGSSPAAEMEPLLGRVDTLTKDGQEQVEGVPVRREKMTKMRRLTAEHMVKSVRTSPHVTTAFDIDLAAVVAIREGAKQNFQKKYGFNLTYTHFVTHTVVQAIKLHPIVNVSVDGDDILFKEQINIGLAVAIETGLIVPVIKNTNQMSLVQIAQGANDLVTRARSKKLKPEDVQGGTFSITNPGGFGSVSSNPIINQPQVAILSMGAMVEKPVVVNKQIVIRPIMQIALTFDHRVIDGEGGAKFLASLKKILETYAETPT